MFKGLRLFRSGKIILLGLIRRQDYNLIKYVRIYLLIYGAIAGAYLVCKCNGSLLLLELFHLLFVRQHGTNCFLHPATLRDIFCFHFYSSFL